MFCLIGQIIDSNGHILLGLQVRIFVFLCLESQSQKSMASNDKNVYKIKTEKRNKIVVEEINPNELKEIWKKLKKLNKTL